MEQSTASAGGSVRPPATGPRAEPPAAPLSSDFLPAREDECQQDEPGQGRGRRRHQVRVLASATSSSRPPNTTLPRLTRGVAR